MDTQISVILHLDFFSGCQSAASQSELSDSDFYFNTPLCLSPSLSFSVQDPGQVEISTALPVYLNHCGSFWPPSPAFSLSVNTAALLLLLFLFFLLLPLLAFFPSFLLFLSFSPTHRHPYCYLITNFTAPTPDCLHHDTKNLMCSRALLTDIMKSDGL